MADAKKCDVCGKLYEKYNMSGKGNHNGIQIVQIDSCECANQAQTIYMDCCPDCMRAIKSVIDSRKEIV